MYLFPAPFADFKIDRNSQCLRGNLFNFINTTSANAGNLKYKWDFGDGTFSVNKNTSHSYGLHGSYFVKLIATSITNCNDTIENTVQVNPMPDARFYWSLACLEDTTYISNVSVISAPDKIVSWDWDFRDGETSSQENPTHIFTSAGLYLVKLIVTSANQCKDTVTNKLVVREHVKSNVITRSSVENDKDILTEWEPVKAGIARDYILERSTNNINFIFIKKFGNNFQKYLDKNLDVKNTSYIYRMVVVDSCNFTGIYSNISKTVVLRSTENSAHPKLYWSAYHNWPGGVKEYQVEVWDQNLGTFVQIGKTGAQDTVFTDFDIHIKTTEFCCRVIAIRADGVQSVSNTTCFSTPVSLWIPDAFTPNGDELNNTFQANGQFIFSFNCQVYSRWG